MPSGKSPHVQDWKLKVKTEQTSVTERMLRIWSLYFNVCNQFVWAKYRNQSCKLVLKSHTLNRVIGHKFSCIARE